MVRLRTLAFGLVCAAAAVGATMALSGGAASGRGHPEAMPSWWRPPADVRHMLARISPARLRQDDLKLVSFGTRHTLSSQTDPNHGIGAARDWIESQFKKYAATSHGAMEVTLEGYLQQPDGNRITQPTQITDVVATLKGTDPSQADRVYYVTAHYDSRVTNVLEPDVKGGEPGANDDASGIDAELELARVMARHPGQATIKFVATAGEEQGLFGGEHIADVAKKEGVNVAGDLNMDIIGSSLGQNGVHDPHTIRVFSEGVPTAVTPDQLRNLQLVGGENDSQSRQLARYVKETGQNSATDMRVKLVWRRDRFLRAGDQVAFEERGWPAVRFTEPNENFNHEHQDVRVVNGVQFGDLPQFVDFPFLARVTRVVGSSLAALVRSPRTPTNAQVVANALSVDTELRWNPVPDSDVVGYEVVWRDSTSPVWTHARKVGNVTDYTIVGLNKDDNQVGVRAIDRDGNRSPVATTAPFTG
jgi:peptidase M28-like protein